MYTRECRFGKYEHDFRSPTKTISRSREAEHIIQSRVLQVLRITIANPWSGSGSACNERQSQTKGYSRELTLLCLIAAVT